MREESPGELERKEAAKRRLKERKQAEAREATQAAMAKALSGEGSRKKRDLKAQKAQEVRTASERPQRHSRSHSDAVSISCLRNAWLQNVLMLVCSQACCGAYRGRGVLCWCSLPEYGHTGKWRDVKHRAQARSGTTHNC